MWKVVHDYNKNPLSFNPRSVLALLYDFDRVFGLGLKNLKNEKIPQAVLDLLAVREMHRKNKEWAKADKVRDEISDFGFVIEDTSKGSKLHKR